MAGPESIRKIDRLVAFVDGVIEKEEDITRHPLASEFRNWAPWNVERLAAISDSLSLAADRAHGFIRLRRALGQPDHYEDAVVELSLAAELLGGGFDVAFVAETKDRKTSDLLIKLDGKELYAEITRLGQSSEAIEWHSRFNREDWRVAEFVGLDVEIKLFKFLSKPRLEELVDTLVARANEVRSSGSPQVHVAEGLLSAEIKRSSIVERSLFRASFPLDVDEVDRLARAIRRKAGQLPKGHPGVLIILDNELHVSPWEQPNFFPIVEKIEEYIYEYGHMTGALIILPFSASEAKPFESFGDNWIAWRKSGSVSLFEDRIFIHNRYSATSIDERVLSSVGCPQTRGGRPLSGSP